ncbi:MAG: hypothetical protein ACTHJL_07375, partial [Amnibacterium sp.]
MTRAAELPGAVVPGRVAGTPHPAVDQERILLATGGGAAGSSTLAWIARRAGTRPVAVQIVGCVRGAALPSARHGRLGRLLGAVHSRLERHAPSAAVTSALVAGDVATVLADAARGADLVVLGRARRPRGRSLAALLMAAAGRPMIVVGR